MVTAILLTLPALADGPKYTYETVELVDDNLAELVHGGVFKTDFDLFPSAYEESLQDGTPPEVRIWVVREGAVGIVEDFVLTDEPRTLEVAHGEDVVLRATANESDGGIASLEISGDSDQGCVDPTGDYGQNIQALWSAMNSDPNPTDDDLSTWMLTALTFPTAPNRCLAGWSVSCFEGDFWATATNLAGLSATTAAVTVVRQ